MLCNCSHHIAIVSTFVLLPPPCIKTTIGAQISGKVKCTSCVKKTGWKVGEEQKVKKVKESREEETDREKEHMQGPRRGDSLFQTVS